MCALAYPIVYYIYYLNGKYRKNPCKCPGPIWFRKLFFGGRICVGAYPRRIYCYVLWAYLTKLNFLGNLLNLLNLSKESQVK